MRVSRLSEARVCAAIVIAATLILSAAVRTTSEARAALRVSPGLATQAIASHKNHCGEVSVDYRQAGTFSLPTDCDIAGTFQVPQFTQSGSSESFGIGDHLCLGPALLQGKHRCYEQTAPSGECTEGANTLWYFELKFTVRTSHGYGDQDTQFDSSAFPFTFTSQSLIQKGRRYGFCVVTSGTVMQDDFANGKGVLAKSDTIHLPMTLTNQFIDFYHSESFDIFLETNSIAAIRAQCQGAVS
jgi:hypothetical protein